MCSLNDPSRIKLIDFGISRMFYEGEPKRRDPATKGYKMVGTLDWASLNAHDGIGTCILQSSLVDIILKENI